jgi:hypothetical protein
LLCGPFRRCYITDGQLYADVTRTGATGSVVVQTKIPDPGSVMSGDFGEILASFYFASKSRPVDVLDPVKWRYKNDRTKAAPKSDVVQLILPSWPVPSSQDTVTCAEVKAKATSGDSKPIESALQGSRQDREGRLTKTLLWLKELATSPGLETVEITHLDRFIQATDHPEYIREFTAVAVISAEFVADETATVTNAPEGCSLIVISVPNLKATYTAVFDEVLVSADTHVEALGE